MSRAIARLRDGAMLVGIAAALANVTSAPAAAQSAACANADLPFVSTSSDPARRQKVEDAILCLTNRERQAAGLPALVESQALHNAAVSHSRDMAKRNYFSHETPEGRNERSRMAAQGYTGATRSGENIVYGTRLTARQVVELWMSSTEHRANILRRDFHEIGVGGAFGGPTSADSSEDGTFTQVFGARS